MATETQNTSRYFRKWQKRRNEGGAIYAEGYELRVGAVARDVLLTLGTVLVLFMSIYTIGEGERGVVTRFGEAKYQVEPGLHFKVPFMDAVKEIEIRERKSVEDLAGATKNQLPITATVSVNWIVNSDAIMEIYRRYGSLEQFENRILDPKLRQAAKAAMAEFNADELIRDRQAATARILAIMVEVMAPYPVGINSPQIENVALPQTYLDAVLAKEKAREDAAREEYNLERQALEAKQAVQTSEATAEATRNIADADAYKARAEAEAKADAIRVVKAAEAAGIREVQSALNDTSSILIDYIRQTRWDGVMPQTVVGGDQDVLMNISK